MEEHHDLLLPYKEMDYVSAEGGVWLLNINNRDTNLLPLGKTENKHASYSTSPDFRTNNTNGNIHYLVKEKYIS